MGCATMAAANNKLTRPIPAIEHVVLISVDGLRPDLALRANMPSLRGMLREGAYTFWAQTVAVAITLPAHTSMLTGSCAAKARRYLEHGPARSGIPAPAHRHGNGHTSGIRHGDGRGKIEIRGPR